MFFSLIKTFFKENDESIVDSINVINRINKICKIAKNVTGEINSDKAIANIKKNKQYKYEFLKALKEADANFYEDRINARSRDLELTDRYGANKRANFMLFFVCAGLSVSIFSIICFKNCISSEMLAVITGVIGVLSGCLKEAFEFEFGGGKNDKKFQTKAFGLDVPTEEALIKEKSSII